MSNKFNLLLFIFTMGLLVSCGESKSKDESSGTEEAATATETTATNTDPLQNKGIGPVTSLTLGELDLTQAAAGKEIFEKMCTACHKWEKKFVGPGLDGITERRTPEWIMNMILNPEEMLAKDPLAKQLMIENNMAVMANQNLKEEEARAILEYFRSMDQEITLE